MYKIWDVVYSEHTYTLNFIIYLLLAHYVFRYIIGDTSQAYTIDFLHKPSRFPAHKTHPPLPQLTVSSALCAILALTVNYIHINPFLLSLPSSSPCSTPSSVYLYNNTRVGQNDANVRLHV